MTVIPDSIEPVEAYRRWNFDGFHLVSLTTGTRWLPGEQMAASCDHAETYSWDFEPRGATLAQARSRSEQMMQNAMHWSSFSSLSGRVHARATYPRVPTVEPPAGFGYKLVQTTHDAPSEGCTCGIYAASTLKECPKGQVGGKVKLWGKVVPGSKGYRAQFAYPSELHVPAKLAQHPAILAYGVPVVITDPESIAMADATMADATIADVFSPRRGFWSPLRVSVACNLGACALNLGLIAMRVIA